MSITWNGVSSDTIGVIVERIPNRHVPTRRFSPQQVAGRNGNILLVDKAFPNVEQEYEVYLSAESQGLPSVARACAEWLMGPDGYCRLTDSYDTTVYREAFLMGGFDIENILNKFGRCTITFSCKPQKYLLTGDTPIEIPAGTTTTYTGDVVQFDGITGASITSLSTTITPIQDLHGYDHPWPAGGGANLLDPDKSSRYTATAYGMAITYLGDDTFTIKGQSTTTSASAGFNVLEYSDMSLSGLGYVLQAFIVNDKSNNYKSCYGFRTSTENKIAVVLDCSVSQDVDITLKLSVATASQASWTPYANICPISGLTGLSVYVSPTQDPDDATVYNVDWTTQAGTVYGGTVDVVTGVLTVTHGLYTFAGDEAWTLQSGQYGGTKYYSTAYLVRSTAKLPADNSKSVPILTSIGEFNYSYNVIHTHPYSMCIAADGRIGIEGNLYNPNGDTLKDVQLVYELATPLTYQLSPQEVEALVGTNNVWSSSGGVSVTVTTPLGGIVTNPTPFEARPLLEVSGVGEITINGKSIQILESVSDFEIDCETMEAEDNSKIYCMDFPELSGGENEIVSDGSITALTVTPRWWTL